MTFLPLSLRHLFVFVISSRAKAVAAAKNAVWGRVMNYVHLGRLVWKYLIEKVDQNVEVKMG